MRYILAVLILLLLAVPAEPHNITQCDLTPRVHAFLKEKYKEELVEELSMESSEGVEARFELWVNRTTGSWSLLLSLQDRPVSCFAYSSRGNTPSDDEEDA